LIANMSMKIIFFAPRQPAGNTLSVSLRWFELEDMRQTSAIKHTSVDTVSALSEDRQKHVVFRYAYQNNTLKIVIHHHRTTHAFCLGQLGQLCRTIACIHLTKCTLLVDYFRHRRRQIILKLFQLPRSASIVKCNLSGEFGKALWEKIS
jgi:hypothetical protein